MSDEDGIKLATYAVVGAVMLGFAIHEGCARNDAIGLDQAMDSKDAKAAKRLPSQTSTVLEIAQDLSKKMGIAPPKVMFYPRDNIAELIEFGSKDTIFLPTGLAKETPKVIEAYIAHKLAHTTLDKTMPCDDGKSTPEETLEACRDQREILADSSALATTRNPEAYMTFLERASGAQTSAEASKDPILKGFNRGLFSDTKPQTRLKVMQNFRGSSR